jgi:hypothetical protein
MIEKISKVQLDFRFIFLDIYTNFVAYLRQKIKDKRQNYGRFRVSLLALFLILLSCFWATLSAGKLI